MAERCDGKVAYFSKSPNSALIRGHLESDGRAVLVDQRAIVMASGPTQERLLPLDQVPMTHGGKCPFQIENALAAAAAAWCLGVPAEVIRQGLQTFAGDAEHSPGRFNVFVLDQATIIIDYAHNASAVSALLAALDEFPAQRRVLVFSGFDRRDEDVVQVGTLLGEGFDRLILFEDRGNPDRRDGELNELLRQGLATGGRVAQVLATPDESAAVELALQDLRSGDLLVIGTETVEATLAAVRQYVHNHPGTACRAPQEPPRALHPSRS
jgi:cyanophycin synthetase